MDSVTLQILKKLAKNRELSVRACAALLPKKTNNHLDFYPLASLIKHGLADIYITTDGKPVREDNEMEIAISFYAWVKSEGKEFEYRGFHFQGADFGDEMVFATAKGYFALDEMRSKRAERLWAFAAGIVTAIVATSLKSWLG